MRGIEQMTDAASMMGRILFFLPLGVFPNGSAAEAGYEARAVTKAEEVDRLTLVVEQSSKTLAAAVAALERMQRARVAA